jgi:hypothetical protein
LRAIEHQGRLKRSVARLVHLALVAMFVLGCTEPQSSDSALRASRIIIKFVDTSRPPPDAFQVRMSDGAEIVLHHERVMSGDNTHLYKGRMSEGQLTVIVRELSERPDVRYAEADRKLSY